MATLELGGIVKRFGEVTTLHGIDLQIASGEFVVLVGPSGCGKSTLLRIISGLEDASAGEIRIDGQRVNEVGAAHRGCSMVFQSYALYPHMSVYDNMAFGLENLGVAAPLIRQKVQAAAELLQLGALLQRKPTQLSGGQRQRVAIGRSIVREPKIFLFDEPLSNLDAELRVSMRAELRALHARLGSTMVYVTHDQVEAMTLADRIVVLRGGRVEQVGTPLQLYNRPANSFVAGFIGSPRMNFVPAALLGPAGLGGLPGGVHTLGIRPEHALLGEPGSADGAAAARLTVEQVEQLGGSSVLRGRLAGPGGGQDGGGGGGEGVPFELIQPGQTALRPGAAVPVQLPSERLHGFDAAGLRC
jgi:multiple sugar transport system ATP-binding protein